MPRTGVTHGGVTVQAPPEDVLKLRQKYSREVFLVVFYDTKRTWCVTALWLFGFLLNYVNDMQTDSLKLVGIPCSCLLQANTSHAGNYDVI